MEAYFGHRARLGIIVPPNNTVSEAEWASVLPAGVTLHAARFHLNPVARTEDELATLNQGLTAACELLAQAELSAIAFACTAPSAFSPRTKMEAAMTAASQLPCATAAAAVIDALEAVAAKKVILISPFAASVTEHEANFMQQEGIHVLSMHSLGHDTYQPGRRLAIHRIAPSDVRDTVLKIDTHKADAIVLSGTNLVTFPVLNEIESITGLPVIGSNQALLWSTLRKANIADHLELGRLLKDC